MTISLLQTIVVGAGGSSSITVSNIPATSDELYVVYSLRSEQNMDYAKILLNSTDSGSAREWSWNGAGFSFTSPSFITAGVYGGPSTTSNTFSSGSFYLSNYAITSRKRLFSMSAVETFGATPARTIMAGNRLDSTSPITSLTITTTPTANFSQNSSLSIYTIKRGVGGATIS